LDKPLQPNPNAWQAFIADAGHRPPEQLECDEKDYATREDDMSWREAP